MEIIIQNLQERIPFPEKLTLIITEVIELVAGLEALPSGGEVSLVLVDDDTIRDLNLRYRQVDAPTDVLSFPQLEEGEDLPPGPVLLLGDIVISLERAVAQAREYGHHLERELAYLVVHGMYHLLGFDHADPGEKQAMRAKEEAVLHRLGLERGP